MHIILSALPLAFFWMNLLASIIVLGLGIFGLITVAGTRDDAFTVIDRQKQNWLMLTGGATGAALLSLFVPTVMMLWIIAAVIVGIYWQDVRPAIRDVLDNSSGSW